MDLTNFKALIIGCFGTIVDRDGGVFEESDF
jgi:hypothetical protein